MLIPIVTILGVAIIVFVIVAATRPAGFRVTRSTAISATASAAFAQVNNLHNFQAWSPWAKLDPGANNTFEGPAAGAGAIFRWDGNSKVGAGSMTITDSVQAELVRMRLEFLKPFAAVNAVEFTFKSEPAQTVVEWSMTGANNFMMKAMGMFIDCDKMCGGMFEQGLANLKSLLESAPADTSASASINDSAEALR